MKLIVLLNAKAGTLAGSQAADDAASIRESFFAAGASSEVLLVPGPHLHGAAREALTRRPDAIVAGGGDGTVSSIAGALVHSGMPLGVLPLGTLNHFARDLGIPLESDEAARVIAAGHLQEIDAAEVNGRTFINNSSIGIYPNVVMDRDLQQTRLGRGKWLATFFALIGALRRFPVVRVRVGTGEQSSVRTSPFVFVGNNRYELNLFEVGERRQIDRGELSLYVANRTGRFGMLRLAVRAVAGRLEQARDFEVSYVPEVWLETRKRHLHLAIDGEVARMGAALHYRILPRALRVFTRPPGAPS